MFGLPFPTNPLSIGATCRMNDSFGRKKTHIRSSDFFDKSSEHNDALAKWERKKLMKMIEQVPRCDCLTVIGTKSFQVERSIELAENPRVPPPPVIGGQLGVVRHMVRQFQHGQ